MESLGKVQIKAVVNGQFWQAMPEQDYSAVVLNNSNTSNNAWFEIMKLSANTIAFKSSYTRNGKAVYVSARHGDWYGKLELQAPHSAQWITAVGGDETFQLINLGNGQVAFKLVNPASYVSARLDIPDTRTSNKGFSLSVKKGFKLFSDNSWSSGTLVTEIGSTETFQLVGVSQSLVTSILDTVAVAK